GSPWLISLERLTEEGLLRAKDLRPPRPFPRDRVEYAAVNRFRAVLLRRAYAKFKGDDAFEKFCDDHRSWLDDFALFSALKRTFRGREWLDWDRDLRLRRPAAIREATRKLAGDIRFHQFVQFQFDRQWSLLRDHCATRQIGLIGDIPIFV